MASQTRNCGLGANVDSGNADWSNPTNVYASDDADASVQLPLGILSDRLWCTTFGFSIPTGATIDGVKVYVERQCNRASAVRDNEIKLIRAGTVVGNNKSKTTFWETTDTVTEYGGTTDMWGTTLTPAQVNASNFGAIVVANNGWLDINTTYARVDHIYIIVYYTPGGINIKVNIGDVWKDGEEMKINIGGSWKTVTQIKINLGDVWRTIFG